MMIKLTDEIGRGKERACYLHPYDSGKVVKVVHSTDSEQMKREVHAYCELVDKIGLVYEHIPNYYGELATTKGLGHVFDLVRDFDGSESRTLHSYLKDQSTVEDFSFQLTELKSYLLENSIVFSNDMSYEGNILVKEYADGSNRLVVIDGLGDRARFAWLNKSKTLLRRKIERRWVRLIQRLKFYEKKYGS